MDRPEDWQNYEDQWQQLDEKVLQAQQVVELQRIRWLLESLVEGDTGASDDSGSLTKYACKKCNWTGVADNRAPHAEEKHNVPPGMTESLFEVVDE